MKDVAKKVLDRIKNALNNFGEYMGMHTQKLVSKKDMKSKSRHPIFLYSPKDKERRDLYTHLTQCVNVYEHDLNDFYTNARKIIKHYEKYTGSKDMNTFTFGQSIRFRVVKGGEEFQLSLYKFFINYTMLIGPIMCGADLSDWKPFTPEHLTNDNWRNQMDYLIAHYCREHGNIRLICEYISYTKYLTNIFIDKIGFRMGLTISNNEFIKAMGRNKDVYESISCTFDVPDDASPSDFEKIVKSRTRDLINFISEQYDLSISSYTRNGLLNPTQLQEFAVNLPNKPDLHGNTIPMRTRTNVMIGLDDYIAHMLDAYGGRKAEIVKLNVSDAGAFERSLSMLMSSIRKVDVDYECDSKYFRHKVIDSVDSLKKLDGRVCTLDPKSDEYQIITPDSVDLIGKLCYIKTPITCTHPRRKEGYICGACYGKLMGPINRDVHIGRLAALNLADDMEQKLLSAKHALATDTNEVGFSGEFEDYFNTASCRIFFNQTILDMSVENEEEFENLYLEFNLASVKKTKDGEGRHYDRSIPEIIVYDKSVDTRVIIKEEHDIPIYLSQEFTRDYFLPAISHKGKDDIIHIAFTDMVDTGKPMCESIFEYQYKNNDLPGALLELKSTLSKTDSINSFSTYDEILDYVQPKFIEGGIHLPDLQSELLIAALIRNELGDPVDWTLAKVVYIFYTINKAIKEMNSAITSILYQSTSNQLAGDNRTYEKDGTSDYDYFIYDWEN